MWGISQTWGARAVISTVRCSTDRPSVPSVPSARPDGPTTDNPNARTPNRPIAGPPAAPDRATGAPLGHRSRATRPPLRTASARARAGRLLQDLVVVDAHKEVRAARLREPVRAPRFHMPRLEEAASNPDREGGDVRRGGRMQLNGPRVVQRLQEYGATLLCCLAPHVTTKGRATMWGVREWSGILVPAHAWSNAVSIST